MESYFGTTNLQTRFSLLPPAPGGGAKGGSTSSSFRIVGVALNSSVGAARHGIDD